VIGKTVSHYKILEKLGEGGMGVVYKAEDTRLRRTAALKFLHPELTRDEDAKIRFIHEAQAAAALNHPNICTIYEVDEHDGRSFIAMEFIEGEGLKDRIERGPLPIDELLSITIQIGEGLHEAHEKGIVHRDIKPGNIMLTSKSQAKILDFGLARLGAHTKITKTDTTLGTAAYMSPEQASGKEVDRRSDIWSLGVVLYEMVAGRKPFMGDYEPAVVYSILNETPEPLTALRTGVPMELERIVSKTLAKDREERYQHVDDVLTDLRILRRELESGASKPHRPVAAGGRRSRLGLYSRVAAFVVVAVAAGVMITRWVGENKTNKALGGKVPTELVPPSQITLHQATFSEDLEEYPAFSPDGMRLAYSRETDGFKHVFIKHLETGEETQLTEGRFDDIQPAWSPDGDAMLFVRSNQPGGKLEPWDVFSGFDGGDIWRVELSSGDMRKLADNAFNPSYSPDGGRIALDASWAGPRRIWTTDAFGRNPQQASVDSSEAVKHIIPRWSPDGSKLVFQNVEKTKFDVKIVDVNTREMTWITNDLFTDINPVWSQSGNEVFFSSYRGGGMNVWRVSVSRDGNAIDQPRQVTTGSGQDVQIAVSPDGKRLAFSILRINADIWRLPVSPETGEPRAEPEPVVATTREDSRGAWSPDGKRVAFNSDRTGDMNIWLYSFDDGSVRQVTSGPGGDYQANWSPDGGRLAFFSSRAGNADIWAVDLGTGELKQLTSDASLDYNPFFSPDGKSIAYQSDRFGRLEVWVMNADGTGQRQLTNTGVKGHFMRWDKGGASIIYSVPSGEFQLFHVPVSGGEAQPLADCAGGSHISFSPDRSMVMDVVGHKVLWVTPLESGERRKVFEFDDSDIRIDYPVWSPDGMWVLFDRLKPQGGDIWLMENPQ
jgi:Tol biopolymer transport system component/tRNA A-37 threonylcarbamoyl transferase component Bud32